LSKKEQHKPLKAVIDKFLQVYEMDASMLAVEIEQTYNELMGKMIVSKTESLWFKNGELHLRLTSSVLRQELSMNKSKISQLINEKIGREVIKEVFIR
jgi:hypothetical protein